MTSMEPAASVFAHISPINKDRGATSVFPLVRSPQRRPGGSRDPVDEEAGVARGAPGPRGEGGTCANALLAFAYIFVSGSMILINAGLVRRAFPYPSLLACLHMTSNACLVRVVLVARRCGRPKDPLVQTVDRRIVLYGFLPAPAPPPLSLVNSSYRHCSVSLAQVIKSTNVVWTYAACLVLGLRTFSLLDFSNLFLIVAGVSVACVEGPKTGCSTYGVFLAFSGIVVEGFRLAAMEKLLASRHIVLSPTTYLYYVAPVNAVGLFLVAVATGEWQAFAAAGYATPPLRVLALNCAFAFALNGLGLVVIRRLRAVSFIYGYTAALLGLFYYQWRRIPESRLARTPSGNGPARAAAVVDEKKARKRTAT
ncbi:hypothetical protein JL721_11457 [Aureococcus anophagefferens]|nr:hypothetical protein JL721_11457 [Aureococcus anophagefferens]